VNYLLYSNGILSYHRYLLCCFVVVLVLLVVFPLYATCTEVLSVLVLVFHSFRQV